jgi:hypothetical protein
VGRLPLIHALGATAVNDALGVAEDHVIVRHAHGLHQLGASDGGSARTVDHQLRVLDVATGEIHRIEQARRGDDRRAVLVVMEHRDVHQLAQLLLDDEAFRRLYILEIDAAEAGC